MSGWIAIDLDKTLAYYNGSVKEIGEPILPMLEFVRGLTRDGYEVRIMTARVCERGKDAERQRAMIQDWTEKHLGVRLKVTNEKDWEMIALYDDRAYHVIPNTGKIVAP